MKLTICKQGAYWAVDFNGAHRFYPDYLGAVTYADKTWRRYYKEQAALAAAIFGPIYFVFLFGLQPMGIALVVVCFLLIWRHRSNIANLLAGKESRIGAKKVVQSIQSEEGQA